MTQPVLADDTIKVDGSSTVYPITEAVAEEFGAASPGAKVTVGISGTGGGFKKFCNGETDISDASRPIKQTEVDLCKAKGFEYVEIPVAFDALTVVINPKNTWATQMTVEELKKLWAPEAQGKVMNWSHVRAGWPDRPVKLFGAGVDSGTYDYFTEAVVGKEHSSRGDFTSSEDDNVLVQGVAGDVDSLGFFGLAYYLENKDKLVAVGIDDANEANGSGAILPTSETVISGTYRPLSRPLFIYVRKDVLAKPLVKKFVHFYVANAPKFAEEVGYVQTPADVATLAKARLEKVKTGSVFASAPHGQLVPLAELMKKDS